MSASAQKVPNWWFPKRGAGIWKVQIEEERHDFCIAVNTMTGERKTWLELKRELYGEGWEEVVREALEHGRNTS